jgi:hypothetical protein
MRKIFMDPSFLLCFFILGASASAYFSIEVPDPVPLDKTSIHWELAERIDNIRETLTVLPVTEGQKLHLGRLLKVYAIARANLIYSTELLVVEKSMVVFYLLRGLLEQNDLIQKHSLHTDAWECGNLLGRIRKSFVRVFPNEAEEFHKYLGKNRELKEIVFTYIDGGPDAYFSHHVIRSHPSCAHRIIPDAHALRHRLLDSYIDADRVGNQYEDLIRLFQKDLGLENEASTDSFISSFIDYAIFSFYRENFESDSEIIKALLGEDFVSSLVGILSFDANDLNKHIFYLTQLRYKMATKNLSIKSQEIFQELKLAIFERLDHHKSNDLKFVIELGSVPEPHQIIAENSFPVPISTSVGSYVEIDIAGPLAQEIAIQTSRRECFIQGITKINQTLTGLNISEGQKINIGKLLTIYIKATANMGYSPDLLTVERSYLLSHLLCRFFGKSRIIRENSLADEAGSCGHYLSSVNTYFEKLFPEESKELRVFLPADEKVIENVLGNVNENSYSFIDDTSAHDRRYLEGALQDLESSLVQEIISKSLALKAKVKQSFFSMNNFKSEYGPLFNQLGFGDADDKYDSKVSIYLPFAITSFYVENFLTNRELYEALFGKDLQLFTTFGEPLWETSDLRRHLLALEMEKEKFLAFSFIPEKRKLLKQFKRLVFERLEIHKEKAGILELEDDLKITPIILTDCPTQSPVCPTNPETIVTETSEKPPSRPRNYELGVIINSIGFLSFIITGFAIFSALRRGNLN